jgi:hypothetical protein
MMSGVRGSPPADGGTGGDAFFVEARYMEVETPVPTGFVPIRVGLLL